MTAARAWIILLAMGLTAGCVTRPTLTESHAARCVMQTFAYLEMKRGIDGVRTLTNTEKDEIFVHVIRENAARIGQRLASFRVQKNRRIDVWDVEKENWRTVGSCD